MTSTRNGTVGRPSGGDAHSKQTRQRIFEAARGIIASEGIGALTTRRVCERAEVSNGTFFHHFPTKAALLDYFLKEGYDSFYLAHKKAPATSRDLTTQSPVHAILAAFDLYAEYCAGTGVAFMRAYYVPTNSALDGSGGAARRDLLNRQMTDITGIVRDAQQTGYFVAEQPAEEIARDCCTIVKGCVLEWCAEQGAFDLKTRMRRVLEIYLTGLTAR